MWKSLMWSGGYDYEIKEPFFFIVCIAGFIVAAQHKPLLDFPFQGNKQ